MIDDRDERAGGQILQALHIDARHDLEQSEQEIFHHALLARRGVTRQDD